MARTMTNKANKANNVRVLRPSWRAAGDGERVAKAERRTRTKRTHPLKGVRMFACRPVVASKIEASETLLYAKDTRTPHSSSTHAELKGSTHGRLHLDHRHITPRSGHAHREDWQGIRHGPDAIGKPGRPLWMNAAAFDEAALAESPRLKAGEAQIGQGKLKVSVYEKDGEHRASLDFVAFPCPSRAPAKARRRSPIR